MIRIQYALKSPSFRNNEVAISSASGNAFIFRDRMIGINVAKASSGNARNTPGNAIDGTVNQPIPIIRLNNTVSRKVSTDPTPSNEGINIPTFVAALLSHLT